MDKNEAYRLPIAHLAYLGDAVIELIARRTLIEDGLAHPQERAGKYVTAVAQSAAAERLMEAFHEDEADVFKRGRNWTHTAPKSATHAQYSRATGLECVFAYVYLCGGEERLWQLFKEGFLPAEGK